MWETRWRLMETNGDWMNPGRRRMETGRRRERMQGRRRGKVARAVPLSLLTSPFGSDLRHHARLAIAASVYCVMVFQ